MKPATSATATSLDASGMQEVDRTLALLAAVQPHAGLEQRVHARLASTPALPWYRRMALAPHRLAPAQWMLATASVVVVASAVTLGVHQHERPAAPLPPAFAAHAPRAAQQPVAAAADVAVPDHPLQQSRTRHRGIRRAYRAQHERSILPRGAAAPMHPQAALPQH